MQKYIDGTEPIPLPTFFVGNYGEGANLLLSASKLKAAQAGLSMEGIPVCQNLTWLIGSGILNLHGNIFDHLDTAIFSSILKMLILTQR